MPHFKHVYKAAREHHRTVVRNFHTTHKHARRILKTYGLDLNDLRQHAARTVSLAGIAASALVGPAYAHTLQPMNYGLVSVPVTQDTNRLLQPSAPLGTSVDLSSAVGPSAALANKIGSLPAEIQRLVPKPQAILPADQAQSLTNLVQSTYNIPVTTQLDGISLNATYGVMAQEQNLPLYPGDNGPDTVPGLPAWGYFANNKASVTEQDRLNEKWYSVVQTFLTPGWAQHVQAYYAWFHGRKIMIVDPQTGVAIVSPIEDSGPNPLLHRAFGGSPEVMQALGSGTKASVYVFFVDDPTNTIPVGPVGGTP